MALGKLKPLLVYLSEELNEGYLSILFFTKYTIISLRFSLHFKRFNSQYKYVVNLFIVGTWSNY